MKNSGCTAVQEGKGREACVLDPDLERQLSRAVLGWDGPALNRKAVSFPDSGHVYVERAFFDRTPAVEARKGIIFHELGHLAGARCEPCADFWAGRALRLDGTPTARDARRAMLARLENRDPKRAEENLARGFGYGVDDPAAQLPRRSAEGWRRGVAVAIDVVEVEPGKWLEPGTAAALLRARAAFGKRVSITSGFRTQAEQQKLYDAWKAYQADPAHAPKANLAAEPGHSNHQDGTAADLAFDSEADREAFAAGPARAAGLSRPVAAEPWHFHYAGGGAGALLADAVDGGLVPVAAAALLALLGVLFA